VTEISITADRREQVRLFILMAASFTYNVIKLALGPMEIFFYYLNYFFDNFFSDMYYQNQINVNFVKV
jgi:hypothetical protein